MSIFKKNYTPNQVGPIFQPNHYLSDDLHTLPVDEFETGVHGLRHVVSKDHILGVSPPLATEGYQIFPFFNQDEFSDIKKLITQYIISLLSAHQDVDPDFTLEHYHKHVANDNIHYAISSWAMAGEVIGPHYSHIKTKVEDLLNSSLITKEIEHKGSRGHFLGFRIVRPGKSDHNPYHRDAWLDYWRDTINIWIPICGFENSNTISLLPGSHLLDDSNILKTKQGAILNGKTYHVPAAVALEQPFEKISPTIEAGEGIIFSPYLLHGNGVNKMKDTTRVSIELRFCKKQ